MLSAVEHIYTIALPFLKPLRGPARFHNLDSPPEGAMRAS